MERNAAKRIMAAWASSPQGAMIMSSNHFDTLLSQLKTCPPQQWVETLINGITQQMQDTNNPTTQNLAQDLKNVRTQIIQSNQQQKQQASV